MVAVVVITFVDVVFVIVAVFVVVIVNCFAVDILWSLLSLLASSLLSSCLRHHGSRHVVDHVIVFVADVDRHV